MQSFKENICQLYGKSTHSTIKVKLLTCHGIRQIIDHFCVLVAWCYVLRWMRCLLCYSECASTPGKLKSPAGHGGNRTRDTALPVSYEVKSVRDHAKFIRFGVLRSQTTQWKARKRTNEHRVLTSGIGQIAVTRYLICEHWTRFVNGLIRSQGRRKRVGAGLSPPPPP